MLASLHGLDHVLDDLLRVAEHHHRLVYVKQFVVQAGITGGHRDDRLGVAWV